MDMKDLYDCGSRMADAVQSAIDSGNFGQLDQSLKEVLDSTLGSYLEQIGKAAGLHDLGPGSHRRGAYREYRSEQTAWQQAKRRAMQTQQQSRSVRSSGAEEASDKPKSLRGLFSMAMGYGMAAVTGAGFFAMRFLSWVTGAGFFRMLSSMLFLLTAVFVGVGIYGGSSRAREKRKERYLKAMGGRDVITFQDLSAATGRSQQYLIKDVRQMLKDGMFDGEAWIDDQETCLITSRSAYMQYRETQKAYEENRARARQAAAQAEQANMSRSAQQAAGKTGNHSSEDDLASYSDETRQILREGRDFIRHIHECNDAIPDEQLTEKLNRLEAVVTRIFDQVARDPQSAPDLHKMMTYYLPITRKLVDAYVELDQQEIGGRNIRKTKKEIEKSLDTINSAFEMILDSFFEDKAWDISSDISTLQTIMARDGLTGGSDFKVGAHTASVGKDMDPEGAAALESSTKGEAASYGGDYGRTTSASDGEKTGRTASGSYGDTAGQTASGSEASAQDGLSSASSGSGIALTFGEGVAVGSGGAAAAAPAPAGSKQGE